jgi:hypothetical protein
MPFNFLLWSCIQEGKTSFTEPRTGKTVELNPGNDECVIICHTDCAPFRTKYNLQAQPVSDVLFFSKRRGHLPIVALVELKSEDYEHAVAQITNVVNVLRNHLPANTKPYYKAVVLLSCASPGHKAERKMQQQLSALNVTLRMRGGVRKGHRPVDLRPLLS